MKYSVITFGCRVNQADSLGFEEELRAAGAEAVSPDVADLVVVNTCSVTASADQGARQTIRRVARANPHARIVVTGCYATRRPEELRALPNVADVVLNDDKARLVQIVRRAGSHADREADFSTAERFGNGDGACGSTIEPGIAGRTAFTLRVQTGCAETCAYCIIPTTRGVPRSVAPAAVLAEVERVIAAGFKEIALTGVHLGSYGRDLRPQSSLINLLTRIAGSTFSYARGAPPPLARAAALEDSLSSRGPQALFRISSLEPMDCTPEIVDLVANSDRFAPHFHLPLQHASDRLLARMRRPYTAGYYADLVADIRARIPDASIGSDIIVGFPGEGDDDFEALASYLERSPLTHVHVFPYSDRPGTEATAMAAKVPGAVVRDRGRRIREIGQRLTAAFRESQVGTIRPGLTLEDGSLVVTDNYLKVRIPPGRIRNEWVRVKVTSAGETMRGEIAGMS
jgi:threonylcarbamoyladenosine tRNA methylthiotransferase MtaB